MSSVVGVCLSFCQHKKLAIIGRFDKYCKIAWEQTFCLLECNDLFFVRQARQYTSSHAEDGDHCMYAVFET
jgi:hypothetical protein